MPIQSQAMPAIFQPKIPKKIKKTRPVWVIVNCSDHRHNWIGIPGHLEGVFDL